MKALHLSNIANMAFSYVNILRQYGSEDNVICYDLKHPLSSPQYALNSGESNPNWFKSIETAHYMGGLAPEPHEYFDWLEALARDSGRYGQQWQFTEGDVKAYSFYERVLSQNFLKQYDLAFGYAYAAVPLMIQAEIPFIPVEIGTLRHIETRNDPFSKLFTYACQVAPHVVITNPDVLPSVKALGIKSFSHIPHPVDEELWKKKTKNDLDSNFLSISSSDQFIIVAPSRHDWVDKGNDKYLKAFARLLSSGVKATLFLIRWGDDLEKSYNLIQELGISNHVFWFDLLKENKLVSLYSIADVVLDQFGQATTFGLTTPKAMSCTIPVITSFDAEVNQWCFEELPPVIYAKTEDEIFENLKHYAKSRSGLTEIGIKSRQWVQKYHSKEIVKQKFEDVKNLVKNKTGNYYGFCSLQQKKMEIVYEAEYCDIYDDKYHKAVAYQLMDKYLSEILFKQVENTKGRVRLLDLGCGPGSMISYLKDNEKLEIYGLDISPRMIAKARELHPGVKFQVGDAENIPWEDGFFDIVLCSGMLHHFPQLENVLNEIKRVLKPKGILIAREPNRDSFANKLPVVSFAHICLRHLIFKKVGMQAVIEPEQHDFHIDFSYNDFINTLSQFFNVKDLFFGQKISYFYDMIEDKRCEPLIQNLEDTLEKLPGLNVVTVCVKDELGVSSLVKTKQNEAEDALNKVSEQLIPHVLATIDLYNWVNANSRALKHKQKNKLNATFIVEKDIVKVKFGRKFFKKKELSFDIPKNNRFDDEFMSFLQENKKHFNAIKICLKSNIRVELLIDILETVRDYAPIRLTKSGDTTLKITEQQHIDYFTQIYLIRGLFKDSWYARYYLDESNFIGSIQSISKTYYLGEDLIKSLKLGILEALNYRPIKVEIGTNLLQHLLA